MHENHALLQAKSKLPNCTECIGCNAVLSPLKAVIAFGQDFKVERGASPEWIFTTGDSPQAVLST